MTHRCLVMIDENRCASAETLGATSGRKGATHIAKSVGKNGANIAADVKAIQSALNEIRPTEGGPEVPLAVDGLCYGKTQAAIHKFQATFMQWPDDRIDAGGKTLARLNAARGGAVLTALEGAGGASGESVLPNPFVVPLILSLLPDVRKCLKAAETEFLLAMPFLTQPKSSPQREARMRRINLHFAIDSFPSPRAAFNEVFGNIKRSSLAIARHHSGPQAAFTGIFEPNRSEKMEKKARAYTFMGGFHRVGEKDSDLGLRLDLIYVCSRMAQRSRDFQVMSVVHEFAHFVGGEGIATGVDDYGYGWIDDPRMKRLVPWQRIHTAQSYGNFAFHCAFNRSPFGPGDLGGPEDK